MSVCCAELCGGRRCGGAPAPPPATTTTIRCVILLVDLDALSYLAFKFRSALGPSTSLQFPPRALSVCLFCLCCLLDSGVCVLWPWCDSGSAREVMFIKGGPAPADQERRGSVSNWFSSLRRVGRRKRDETVMPSSYGSLGRRKDGSHPRGKTRSAWDLTSVARLVRISLETKIFSILSLYSILSL